MIEMNILEKTGDSFIASDTLHLLFVRLYSNDSIKNYLVDL